MQDERLLPHLSAYIRQINDNKSIPELTTENWRNYAQAHTTTPASQKLIKLLELIAARSTYHGDEVELDPAFDYPLMDARSNEEVHYLFNEAKKRHYLESTGELGNPIYSLTVDGWEHLDQLKSKNSETKAPETKSATQMRQFTFVQDAALRTVLDRDYAEIHRAYDARCWKSVIILCGGAIEAMLTDLLLRHESNAKGAVKASKRSDLSRWDLADLINVSVELGLVSSGVEKLSHSVREYRNLVHPGNEIRNQLTFDTEEATIAVEVLHIIHRDLSK